MGKIKKNLAFISLLFGPYRKYSLLLLIIMMFGAFFEAIGLGLIIPLISFAIGDKITSVNSRAMEYFNDIFSMFVPHDQRLLGVCVIIFVIFLVKNIFIYSKSILTIHFSDLLRRYWSDKIMDKYIHADFDYIISQKRGHLINDLINEPVLAAKLIANLADLIAKTITTIGIYTVMLLINWQVTIALSLIILFILGGIGVFGNRYSKFAGKKRLKFNQEMTAEGEQFLNGIRQIKLFSLENTVLKSFSEKMDSLNKVHLRLGVYRELPMPVGEVLIILFFVFGLIYFEYFKNGSAVAFLPTLVFLAASLQRLSQNTAVLISGGMWIKAFMPSINVISSIMGNDLIQKEILSEGITIKQLPGDIYFKNVEFSHSNSAPLFNNVTLSIPKNKITAIVGKSGSGKSTLVDLLCGLFKGYKGKIMIGDLELREINLSSWRKIIGFVSQDTFLFNISIRDNILMGNGNASESDVIKASMLANAHEFIEALPQGYNTILGDRGLKISGGQRQRITVARALVRTPDILIFDEATSSLDAESEGYIQKSMEEIKVNKTIIVIAHRLSTIKNADKIYVMEKGKVIESGTYSELKDTETGYLKNMLVQQDYS